MPNITFIYRRLLEPLVDDSMICNETCCIYEVEGGSGAYNIICFNDYNFTDLHNLTETARWEEAVRWTFVSLVVFFGVFGNLAIILILFTNRLLMRTSVNYFILNMAISDLILASAGPITFTIRDINQFWVLGELWCHLDGFIQVTVMIVSVLSLSTISIDRLLGILHPTHRHLRHWQALLTIACIWLFSASFAVPFYIYRIYGVRMWNDVTEVYCGEETDNTQIYWLVAIIVLNWIPLTIMLVCYVKLFAEFKKHVLRVEGKEHPGILTMKKKFVKMLFTMILVFVACWFPFQAFVMFREKLIFTDDGQVENQEVYDIAFTTSQYIIYLNPAINPFVYGLMHANFKRGFRITFSCFFKNQPFVLVRSYGSQAYVWSRKDRSRHTIPTSGYKTKTNRTGEYKEQKVLRRAFSFDHSPDLRNIKFQPKRRSLFTQVSERNGDVIVNKKRLNDQHHTL